MDIYTSEGCPLIKILILIQGLGECERVALLKITELPTNFLVGKQYISGR